MTAIAWDESMSVGVEACDDDHRQLINYINEFQNATLNQENWCDAAGDVLERLLLYADVHFRREEDLMDYYGYPGLQVHRLEHQRFTTKVKGFIGRHKSSKPIVPVEITVFLRSWLLDHIMKSDRDYKTFFNDRGVS